MSLEDRDWYREKPSEAWNERWRTTRPSDRSRGLPLPPPRPGRKRPGRRVRLDRWFRKYALVPLTILAAGSLLWTHRAEVDNALMAVARHLPDLPSNDPAPTLAPWLPGSVDPSIVHLNARPGLDAPVRVVTRWTISDPRFGRVEVFVPVGKTPREALTVALAERGYQVVR